MESLETCFGYFVILLPNIYIQCLLSFQQLKLPGCCICLYEQRRLNASWLSALQVKVYFCNKKYDLLYVARGPRRGCVGTQNTVPISQLHWMNKSPSHSTPSIHCSYMSRKRTSCSIVLAILTLTTIFP